MPGETHAVLVTGRLPDVDASHILPVVHKLDAALEEARKAHPGFKISVTGLPAIAARNSASMIHQLNEALAIEVVLVAVLLGLAFKSVFVGAISLLPGLFPVVAAGAHRAGQRNHHAPQDALPAHRAERRPAGRAGRGHVHAQRAGPGPPALHLHHHRRHREIKDPANLSAG
jgi:hypothetical protein